MGRDAQGVWAALRRLYEGEPPTAGLLALCCGRAERTIAGKAAKEGWRKARTGDAGAPSGRDAVKQRALERFQDRLLREMERLSAAQEDFGKAEFDAVNALARLIDKINDLTRTAEGANEKQEPDDEILAAALERLDRRIVELARELAGGMGGTELCQG